MYTRDTVNKSRFVYANITVNDNINVPLLKDIFSIENDKSHVPPVISNYNLTKDNIMALIIGYIDGDGSIVRRDLKRFAESKSLPIMSRKWDNIT